MTRQEELYEAAEKFSDEYKYSEDVDYVSIRVAFIEGAEWSNRNLDLSSLWHDASEEPKENMDILCILKNRKVHEVPKIDNQLYDWLRDNNGIDKWAYISDLLPKKKNKL